MKITIFNRIKKSRDFMLRGIVNLKPCAEVMNLGCGNEKFSNEIKTINKNELIKDLDIDSETINKYIHGSSPLVSVIIPTFNSEKFLEKCLLSIINQTYKNIEIIVVDNFSTDKTNEIAKKISKIITSKSSMPVARNVGLSVSKGQLILSIDSDMELTPNVIEECVSKVKNGFDAVIIPELSVGEGFWGKCKSLEKSCYIGDDLIEATRFFNKQVFEVISGYDNELVFGEDWDLHQRIINRGFKISRINSSIMHHEGKLLLRKNIMKKRFYGKSLRLYKMKHSKVASLQLSIFRPAYLKNWRKLAKDPLHTIGMILMKFCEFSAVLISSLE